MLLAPNATLASTVALALACAACDGRTGARLDPASVTTEGSAETLRAIERGAGDGPVVVMLHGYGARPESFLPFADRTDLPPGTRMVLPFAPEPTHPPFGPDGGFMWWRFSCEFHDARALSFPAMATARTRLASFLDALEARLGVASSSIVLGGFSQGAMLALDFALHDPRPLAGLVLLSGTLVDADATLPRLAGRRGLRVYQSHGRADDVLYYPPAEELADAMRAAGLDVRFTTFEGGHEVAGVVSTELTAFLREVTSL